MAKYVFDIECDGLLNVATKMHIIYFRDIDTEEMFYYLEGDDRWKARMNAAEAVIGHNILGFDFEVLMKLFGYKVPKHVKVYDTMIMSQVLDYQRFGRNGHSLEAWGTFLGFPKQEHEDWSVYTEEMRTRCQTDCILNHMVYDSLQSEIHALLKQTTNILPYLRAEHYVAEWQAKAQRHGWPFDVEGAIKLRDTMQAEVDSIRKELEPRLGYKCVPKDKVGGKVVVKELQWTRAGFYVKYLADWFGIDPCSGYPGEERMIAGPFCRVEIKKLQLSSTDDVKTFLFRNGWVPDEWNTKRDPVTFEVTRTSPKITEDSLEFIEGAGKLYAQFNATSSRLSILNNWLDAVDESGMLHGDSFTIGTPSMRMRHSIICNIPSPDVRWGKEVRELFTCLPGWKMVGCDSAGNQARGLAHYLGSQEYIDLLLHGDIHQYNADVLTKILQTVLKRPDVVPRKTAKRILYAFLFGASGSKIWSYIYGHSDQTNGNKLKNEFIKAVPGFKALKDTLESIYSATKKYGAGYIPSIAGNRVYVDSYHKLLVYLLQACEKVTCSAAVMLTMQRLEEREIPYIPLIMYHDEEDFMVPEEFAEEAAAIGKQAFKDGPKMFGIEIMDGDAKIGHNWYEVH